MSPILATLYLLCMVFLPSFGLYVLIKDWRARVSRLFGLLTFALLGWVATLFAFSLLVSPLPLLLVGRLNFAAMAFVVTIAFLFSREIAGRQVRFVSLLWLETWIVALASAFTPWIDRAESISSAGIHVTGYGTAFPLYVAHILVFVAAALATAFLPPSGLSRERIIQLRAVGTGILGTAVVSLLTNLILPYAFGNFDFIHVGTISTILFLGAAGYAVFAYHLFDIRVAIRATFVYGGLVALALELYSLSLTALAKILPLGVPGERETAATTTVLVINAFTQEPIRKWLGGIVGLKRKHAR